MVFVADGAIKVIQLQGNPEDVDEFVRLFNIAWMQLPLEARDQIAAYWVKPSEFVSAIHLWTDVSLPRVWNDGHHAHFSLPILREMGESFSVQAIMHELAHVYFYSVNEPNHWVPAGADKPTKEMTSISCEELVHEKLQEWGVDQSDLLAWRDKKEFQMKADNDAKT
ncbi:MAG: hypothetical protein QM703_08445 [Gemmatales bacterium]